MPRFPTLSLLGLTLLAAGFAVPAHAVPLQIEGRLGVQLLDQNQELIPFPRPVFTGKTVWRDFAATVEVSAGRVQFAADALSVDFAGTTWQPIPPIPVTVGRVTNRTGTLSFGGADTSCPQALDPCVTGGGFGGELPLALRLFGVTPSPVIGAGGVQTGLLGFAELAGAPFTASKARLVGWFQTIFIFPYVSQRTASASGTFRGLPSTYTGPGAAGFSLVTPAVVRLDTFTTVGAFLTLEVDFVPEPSPMWLLAAAALFLAVRAR